MGTLPSQTAYVQPQAKNPSAQDNLMRTQAQGFSKPDNNLLSQQSVPVQQTDLYFNPNQQQNDFSQSKKKDINWTS